MHRKNTCLIKVNDFHTQLRNPFAHTSLPSQPRQQMCKAKHTSAGLPWEGAEVPRQLREVVCIPDSCTTRIFKQCLEQGKQKEGHDTIINLYQLLKVFPEKQIFEAAYVTLNSDGLSQNTEFFNSNCSAFHLFLIFFKIFLGQQYFRSDFLHCNTTCLSTQTEK